MISHTYLVPTYQHTYLPTIPTYLPTHLKNDNFTHVHISRYFSQVKHKMSKLTIFLSYSSLLLLGISSLRNYVFLKQRSRNLSKSWQFLFSKLSGVRIGLVVYHPLESTWHHPAFTAIISPVKSKRIFSKSWNIFSTEIDN